MEFSEPAVTLKSTNSSAARVRDLPCVFLPLSRMAACPGPRTLATLISHSPWHVLASNAPLWVYRKRKTLPRIVVFLPLQLVRTLVGVCASQIDFVGPQV